MQRCILRLVCSRLLTIILTVMILLQASIRPVSGVLRRCVKLHESLLWLVVSVLWRHN
jgi:hypothetical protein